MPATMPPMMTTSISTATLRRSMQREQIVDEPMATRSAGCRPAFRGAIVAGGVDGGHAGGCDANGCANGCANVAADANVCDSGCRMLSLCPVDLIFRWPLANRRWPPNSRTSRNAADFHLRCRRRRRRIATAGRMEPPTVCHDCGCFALWRSHR